MPSGTYNWSQTPASNASADSSINWQEGQAPSSVNDSARAMMAVLRKHDDDISGAIVTGGISTAFTVTSYSVFNTLANMNGQIIAFSPHTTSGAAPTLNVDGLGAKPVRSAPAVDLLPGVLIQGTPYAVLYNNADGAWYLRGFFGNPYSIPLGGGMDYWLPTAPNSSFVFPIGQAISRTTYATLFSAMGTTHGIGDGSTTFNLPDKTGRVSVMKEASATRLTATHFGGNSTALGAVGGSESHTLTTAQLAAHSHANTLNDPTHTHSFNGSFGGSGVGGGGASAVFPGTTVTTASATGITITNANAGSGNAHNNVQPTIVCNYIMRII